MTRPPASLLMTRPRAQAERFVADLGAGAAGLEVVYAPLLEIAFTGTLPDLDGLRGLIFTSANGVAAWVAAGGPRDLPAFTVGDRSAEAARAAGLTAHSAGGDAKALLAMLAQRRPAPVLLHVRGRESRGDVAARLSETGITTREAVLYAQRRRDPERARRLLAGDRPVIAPLFSPRTAAYFAAMPVRAPLLVAALSEAVAKPLASLHIQKLRTAAHPDSLAMREAVLALRGDLAEMVGD